MTPPNRRCDWDSLAQHSARLARLLKDLYPMVRGLRRFPMRRLAGPAREAQLRHEAAVRERFFDGGCNLFAYSLDPDAYVTQGLDHFSNDLLAYRFWILSQAVPLEALEAVWGRELLARAAEIGLLVIDRDAGCTPLVRLIPFDGRLVVTDPYSKGSGEGAYLSYDSMVAARWVQRLGLLGMTVLDLCCGSGLLGLAVATGRMANGRPRNLWGVDINSRAVACFRVNRKTAGLDGRQHCGSYSDAARWVARADTVVFNPPFEHRPVAGGSLAADGGHLGLLHVKAILTLLAERLRPDAVFFGMAQAPVAGGIDLLLGWLPSLDRLAVDYHVLDEFSPWPGCEHRYTAEGIDKLRQVFLTGTRGEGGAPRVHFCADAYCFG